jgi:hypothetical protein
MPTTSWNFALSGVVKMGLPVFYTNTDQIRAVLGISVKELPDKTIADAEYEALVESELDPVYENHATAIAASEDGAATPAEISLGKKIRLLCAYEVAVLFCPQLQALIFKKIEDSKVKYERYSEEGLQQLKDDILAKRDYLRGVLNPDYVISVASMSFINISRPGYDPVTGLDLVTTL